MKTQAKSKMYNIFYKGEFYSMKQFSGFEAKKASSGREILPAGGYVCEIKSVKDEQFDWGSRLALAIDVAEGEYAGFFKKDFDGNEREDKKWRGIYRINIPKDDGTEQDGWTKRTFGNFIWAVQESNSGYVWNWDEKTLKGKKVGVLFREEEWEMDGRTGWTTKAAGSVSVEDCRSGNFKQLKPKPLKNRPVAEDTVAPATVDDEDSLPF